MGGWVGEQTVGWCWRRQRKRDVDREIVFTVSLLLFILKGKGVGREEKSRMSKTLLERVKGEDELAERQTVCSHNNLLILRVVRGRVKRVGRRRVGPRQLSG